MKFVVGSAEFDTDHLDRLGGGGFGEVYACSPATAAKIIDDVNEPLARKLLQICDIGTSVERDPEIASCVAFPSTIAKGGAGDSRSDQIVGFAMRNLGRRPKLLELGYDLTDGRPREVGGCTLSDDVLVSLAFRVFQVLHSLERRHIVVGDVSYGNVLFAESGDPAFVDLDSAHIGDWESDSNGTPGYTDPHLSEGDRNSMGGLRFDPKSDIYALTVLMYEVVIGVHPYDFDSHPPMTKDIAAVRQMSSLRLATEGESCLRTFGASLANAQFIKMVADRVAMVRRIPGRSGRDGAILVDHFDHVLNRGDRTNLVDRLEDRDPRSPGHARLVQIGFPTVTDTWAETHGPRRSRSHGIVDRRLSGPYDFDPPALGEFMRAHGVDILLLVADDATA